MHFFQCAPAVNEYREKTPATSQAFTVVYAQLSWNQLVRCTRIAQIYVSTDDKFVMELCELFDPERVKILKRPR